MEEQILEYQDNVLLVGVDTQTIHRTTEDFEHSMEELKSLAEAAGKKVVGIITQKLDIPNKGLYIGTGKIHEVKEYAGECGANEIIFDNALSPSQIRNLVKELDMPISDRTNLILEIFAIRAQTREAKLQVETARLQYMLPRLVGLHESLSRQGGASGSMSNKGAGEKKLELDRRRIEHRIAELRKELEQIAGNRMTQRSKRDRSGIPQVALVGYTNAGKSTILNQMVEIYGEREEKKVLEKDMLFATLETSVRRIDTSINQPFFLVDTVGFIDKLPHGLVKAFRSTLEEVRYADLLVHVVDFSDENHKQHMEVTMETLKELEAAGIPQLVVYNKADIRGEIDIPKIVGNQIFMCAREKDSIKMLAETIQKQIYADRAEMCFLFPFDRGDAASYFMEQTTVLEKEYRPEGLWMRVSCHKGEGDKYAAYLVP
ncbi:MAG: GTPase HflX [Lachnospiraceae bacterium]|nr:GTPase HflX [Lachnospiraceae bacterium]